MRGQLKAIRILRMLDKERERCHRAQMEDGLSSPASAAKARRNAREEEEEKDQEDQEEVADYDSDACDDEQVILSDELYDTVNDLFMARWNKMHHPLHSAALLLDPEFQHQEGLLQDPEHLDGWKRPSHICFLTWSPRGGDIAAGLGCTRGRSRRRELVAARRACLQ